MKITAAVVREKSKPFSIEQLQLEEPRDDEVLVRVVATGVCHTDITVRDQYYPVPLPAVLGHEGAGIVEKVGAGVTKVKPGDHVVLSYLPCGQCGKCHGGKPAYCDLMFPYNFGGGRLDGSTSISDGGDRISGFFFGQSSFATHALANQRNVVKVRKDAPLKLLGPLGCGIQTGAGGVLNSLAPEAGTSIAIFGAGAVGLSAVMAARVCGCTKIIAIDLNGERLKLATELGATDIINPRDGGNTVEIIQSMTGTGVNYSLETTAVPTVLRQAVESLTTTGVCGLIGGAPMGTEITLDMNNILFGRTLRGIVEGDSVADVFIPRLIDLHMQGRFPFDRLVKFYPLDKINEAITEAESGSTIKPILEISAE